jgi:hypothetical protein
VRGDPKLAALRKSETAAKEGSDMQRGIILAFLGLGLVLTTGEDSRAGAMQPDPLMLYGPRIVFDIERNGENVGRQVVNFSRSNGDLTVHTVSEIEVTVLFVPVYRFRYEATTVWRDGRMIALSATTEDDGKVSQVHARIDAGKTVIDGPDGKIEASGPLLPGEHWNMDEVRQAALINSITGKVNRIQVSDQGKSAVQTRHGAEPARQFTLSGDLALTTWYDADGRWVGLRFKAKDGSQIDYICRQCGSVHSASTGG